MSDSINRHDVVNEIHEYFWKEIEKTPCAIDEDGYEVYTDTFTVNSLLIHNKELSKRIKSLPSAEPLVLTCDGCRHVGTYDTDFPCSGCVRREKDYYEQER